MQKNKHKHLHNKHHTVKYAVFICFELEWMSCCRKLGPSDELFHLVDLLGTADNPCFDVVCDLLFTPHLYKFTSRFYGRPERLSFLRKRDPVLPCWSWWLCCMWGSGIQPKKFKKGDIFHCITANLMPCYAWFSSFSDINYSLGCPPASECHYSRNTRMPGFAPHLCLP